MVDDKSTPPAIEQRKLDLEVARLTQDKEIKEQELVQQKLLKEEEFAIQREQISASRLRLFGWKLSPSFVTIIVSLLAVLGTVLAGINQANQNRKLEEQKARYQKQANDQKFKSDLTLNAIRTGNPKEAAQNLLFLIEAKLLDDPNNSIRDALKKYQPTLPVSSGVPVPHTASSREVFFTRYKIEFGSLPADKAAVLTQLFSLIEQYKNITDVRYVAYILATIKWETADSFQPIREAFYVNNDFDAAEAWRREHLKYYPYYGRGYVLLTWKENYRIVSEALGLAGTDSDLVTYPDKALEPQIAYRILAYGMLNGIFTGKKLSQYITDDKTDYINARQTINRLDKATHIADVAKKFETILRTSLAEQN
jgi:hypothetical protein